MKARVRKIRYQLRPHIGKNFLWIQYTLAVQYIAPVMERHVLPAFRHKDDQGAQKVTIGLVGAEWHGLGFGPQSAHLECVDELDEALERSDPLESRMLTKAIVYA
jgi:hypothetical protein